MEWNGMEWNGRKWTNGMIWGIDSSLFTVGQNRAFVVCPGSYRQTLCRLLGPPSTFLQMSIACQRFCVPTPYGLAFPAMIPVGLPLRWASAGFNSAPVSFAGYAKSHRFPTRVLDKGLHLRKRPSHRGGLR